MPRKLNTPHNRGILPVPTLIRGKQSKSPILDYFKSNEIMMNRISGATGKNSIKLNGTMTQANKEDSVGDIETVEKKTLNFINPEKFIVQNNFIPQPSILLNLGTSA